MKIQKTEEAPPVCAWCNGEGWHMARFDSVWPERLVWNGCMRCNKDGTRYDIPRLTYEEFLRRKRGEV